MSNFITRTLSGVAMVAIIIAAILVSPHTLTALCVVIAVFGMVEFFRLAPGGDISRPLPLVAGVGVVLLSCYMPQWLILSVPLVFMIFFAELYRGKENPLMNTAVSMAGIVYIAVPMALLACMGAQKSMYALFYMVLIWINDVGAYLVGISVGKHRLFERISPKKSWEGFFGGVILAFVAAWAVARWYDGNYVMWMAVGIVLPLSAVAGDLVESMFKRAAAVKDSGRWIPGHGGFLDRFDAVFFSMPFVYVIVKFLG